MNQTEKFCRVEIKRCLKDPLKAVASAKGITTRALTSQILERFIRARSQLLSEIAKDNGEEQKTQA